MKILLVEDDPAIADSLRDGLTREGYQVTLARTGEAALAADSADVVLLDLGLPDLDGRAVCRRLREHSNVPIIVVTARSAEIDRVELLELGADDYLVKPFGFRELVARIRAVLRRAGSVDVPVTETTVGQLHIDHRAHEVTFRGSPVDLTPREFDLLAHLAADPGAVCSRDQVMHDVWDEHWWGSTKTLDVHLASLRKKLAPEVFETVRGVGIRLVADPK
ncbi:MAG: response regulator transcription factor [Acidimicrobiia bacterium]|nr:response regulator transcription factor [Actinomycetota bacterium]MBL6925226.1 response regulator transcription factor [Acidimicrobiia bacterium]